MGQAGKVLAFFNKIRRAMLADGWLGNGSLEVFGVKWLLWG